MPKVVHSAPSDSKGYTRYVLDEAIGQNQAGVRLVGPKMKLSELRVDVDGNEYDEAEYEIVLHGVRELELPNEVKSLKAEDGSVLKLKG